MTNTIKSPAMIINFYTTSGCHLCEQALAMLHKLALDVTVVEVEIADDELLLAKYGLVIPVVNVANTGQEIGWPFSAEELREFIGGQVG
jgi:glutaredoxin